jgi:stage V sporulation protein D (sporulation-specific penicillin-binding protein)
VNYRLWILAFLFALSGAAIVARVAQVQISSGDHYRAEARNEHFGQQEVRAPRGAILDRNGYPLATTVDAWDVLIDRDVWRDAGVARAAADAVAPILGMQAEDLVNEARRDEDGYYLAYAGLDFEKGKALEDLTAPGLRLVSTSARFYPEGDLASTLIGFVGRDQHGLTGIERDFDADLGGQPGTVYFERDSIGNPIAIGQERIGKKPVPGGNIRLTLDRYVQRIVERELDARIAANGALGGTIIVMDPKSGAILAMASRPGFRLSELRLRGDLDLALLRNRAVTDLYEPGSVFKTLTAAAAVDLGLVGPETTYNDTGVAYAGPAVIRNWDYSINGITSVTGLLQRSLNTGAVWLAQTVGARRFYEYMARFGISEPTHVGLSGDQAGILRTPDDPAWSEADLGTNSFGQGVAVSPLHVITAIASLANGGKLMRPYIVEEMDTPEGPRTFEPVMVRQVVREETARTMADMMNQVVEGSPGHLAAIKGYHAAGKTGTTTGATLADGAVHDGNIASFVGFAPVDDPKMIMLVKLDFKEDRLGGRVAAPVFAALAPDILAYLGARPDGPQLVASGR